MEFGSDRPVVRPPRPDEAPRVASLLYLSSAAMYDRYAGGPEAAVRVLTSAFGRPGTTASAEAAWVAEVDGRLAAAMVAFPALEGPRRGRRFMRLTIRRVAPWRWPGALSLYRRGAATAPAPPPDALYVDAIATAPDARRRGAALALLAHAERRARDAGLPRLALDTAVDNHAARALYERAGFREFATSAARPGLPGFAAYLKEIG